MDPTQATEIVRQAGTEGGWMAAALCAIGCTMVGGLIVLVRNMMQRQSETDKFIRGTMTEVIDDNSLERERLSRAIARAAPKLRCVHDSDVAAAIGDAEKDDSSLGETGKRVMERRKERQARAAKEV